MRAVQEYGECRLPKPNEVVRLKWVAATAYFKVEVCPCRLTGITHTTNSLSLVDNLARTDG